MTFGQAQHVLLMDRVQHVALAIVDAGLPPSAVPVETVIYLCNEFYSVSEIVDIVTRNAHVPGKPWERARVDAAMRKS